MIAFLRVVVTLAVVGLAGWGAWEARRVLNRHEDQLAMRDDRIDTLESDVAVRDERIVDLETALRLLKVDHRLARLVVADQRLADGGGVASTDVTFQELTPDGYPMGAGKTFTLEGDMAYIDALVIKFDDAFVERGDVWRGTSICLFRRIFGERQQPVDGFALDPSGKRPGPYADGADEGADLELWQRFWDYANDAELARQAGVRAIHGEAPFIQLRAGRTYLVELRASSGLSIRPE